MKEIKYTVSVRTFVILFFLRFQFRYVEKLRFLRFRFRALANLRRYRYLGISILSYVKELPWISVHLNIHHHQAVAGSLEGKVAECLTNSYFQTFLHGKGTWITDGNSCWVRYRFVAKIKQLSYSGVFIKLLEKSFWHSQVSQISNFKWFGNVLKIYLIIRKVFLTLKGKSNFKF